jgi:hypothetical protein
LLVQVNCFFLLHVLTSLVHEVAPSIFKLLLRGCEDLFVFRRLRLLKSFEALFDLLCVFDFSF